jgi:AraC-like DNA-binding protein
MIGGGAFIFVYLRSRNLRRLYQLNVDLVQSDSSIDTSMPRMAESQQHTEEDALFAVYQKIKQAMEEEKMYRLADLTLPLLSAHIASNDKYTSSAISTYAKTNFNGFVNRYRINEAKRTLLEQGDQAIITVVAEECGFASRSTFYKAFTEQTGMTPKAFIHFAKRS